MLRKVTILLVLLVSSVFATDKHFDVRTPSKVSVETLNKNLKGVLKDSGEHFKKAEEEHNVNATFLAAVAILESGNGTSNKAVRRGNAFGLKGRSFSHVNESIYYTASIIASQKGYYYGRKKYTIAQIGKVYAPTWDAKTNARWASNVASIMRRIEQSQTN